MRKVFWPYHSSQIWIVLAVAFAVRAAYIFLSHDMLGADGISMEDSVGLIRDAEALLAGQTLLGFDGQASFDAAVMPIVPLLLSIVFSFGLGLFGFVLIQAVVDAFTCAIIAAIAGSIRRDWYLIAGLIAAFNPTQVVLAGLVLTDSLFLFFSAISLYGLTRLVTQDENQSSVWTFVFWVAVGLGLACLTRTAILFWVPVALLILGVVLWRTAGLKRAFSGVLATLCVVALCISPILYRNIQTYGQPSLTPQGGAHLLFWVVPLVANFGGSGDRNAVQVEARERLDAILAADPSVRPDDAAVLLGVEMLAEMGPVTLLRAWAVGAAMNVGLPATVIAPISRAIPHDSFHEAPGEGIVDKVLSYVSEPRNQTYVAVNLIAAALSLGLGGLVLVGFFRLARRRPAAWLLLMLWAGYFLALNGPIASPKYRLPIEPVWVILIVAALAPRSTAKGPY